jgi:8-oxo-dGTP pyrophosphatase MutT (NUDIX family)
MSTSDDLTGVEANPWITHERQVTYANDWIEVSESQVTTPTGTPGIYGVVHYKNRAVGVVPIDQENHTWLVGQYRYPTDTYEWEIPEGGAPFEESLEDCAHRELAEETGLRAAKLELLIGDLQLSNSVSDERAYLYVARELSAGPPAPEETEKIQVRRLPLGEAIEMIDRGEIRDAMSVIALQCLAAQPQ